MLIQLARKQKEYIQKVFIDLSKQLGNQNKLAASLGLSKQAISQIITGKNMPSAHLCLLIESRYGIKKEILRPDIFTID